MYVINVKDVREHQLDETIEGANKVRVKYLLHAGVGARRLQYRLFTIDVGGYTPLEKHAHEHEVFMLKGKALFKGGDKEVIVDPEDVIFIPSYEVHQVKNVGDEPVQFLCTKETHELPKVLLGGRVQP
jgi:quercetin dioxygenase-like cupin family protein